MKSRKDINRCLYIILFVLVLIPYLGMWLQSEWYQVKTQKIRNASVVIISKEKMTLRLIDYSGNEKAVYPIACGKNYGNKEKRGDLKTPEGVFFISDIQDASTWRHDFGDGKGEIAGAYGPYFIRLEVPGHKGIGIHGTHKPESIGTRDTEGCIRLHNEDILDLCSKIHVGTMVAILPAYEDVLNTHICDSLRNVVLKTPEYTPQNKRIQTPNSVRINKVTYTVKTEI